MQSASTDFIPPTRPAQLVAFVDRLTGNRALTAVFLALGVVALLAVVRDGVRRSLELWQRILVFGWLIVPPVVLLVVSELRPLWRDRYMVAIAPALAILIAFAITRFRTRAVQAGVLAVVLALSAVSVRDGLRRGAIEDLPAGAELLLEASQPTDAVVYSGAATRTPFLWVLQQQAGDRPLPRDIAVAPDGTADQVRDLFAKEVDASALTTRLASCDRVWVISVCGRPLTTSTTQVGSVAQTLSMVALSSAFRFIVFGSRGVLLSAGSYAHCGPPRPWRVARGAVPAAAEHVRVLTGELGHRAEALGAVALVLQETNRCVALPAARSAATG